MARETITREEFDRRLEASTERMQQERLVLEVKAAELEDLLNRHASAREMPVYVDAENMAYLEGTTTKVIEVAAAQQAHDLTPEALQNALPHLTLSQVVAALLYYHAHKPELDAQIEQRRRYADALRAATPNQPTRAHLQKRLHSRA